MLKAYNEGRHAWDCIWRGLLRAEQLVNPYNVKIEPKLYAAFRKGYEEAKEQASRLPHACWFEQELRNECRWRGRM